MRPIRALFTAQSEHILSLLPFKSLLLLHLYTFGLYSCETIFKNIIFMLKLVDFFLHCLHCSGYGLTIIWMDTLYIMPERVLNIASLTCSNIRHLQVEELRVWQGISEPVGLGIFFIFKMIGFAIFKETWFDCIKSEMGIYFPLWTNWWSTVFFESTWLI